jgi:hypothetical protein
MNIVYFVQGIILFAAIYCQWTIEHPYNISKELIWITVIWLSCSMLLTFVQTF